MYIHIIQSLEAFYAQTWYIPLKRKSLSLVWLFVTPWTIQSMEFSKSEYWNGAYPFSTGSSRPRNHTGVSCITGGFFTNWALREAWYIPLIKAQTQELKCFSLDIQGSIILSICKLSFKKYFPPLFPHTDLICLQFNEIYAHWIKIEESITLQHRKRSVSKRQLESDVSEHLLVAIKSRRMTALSLL